MALVSTGSLVDALRQYGLLAPAQLAELIKLAPGRCGNARDLAKVLGRRGWLTIYQINQLLAGKGQELVYGPYHVLDILGQGGLSKVFKARHRDYHFLAAIKVICPEALASAEGKERFLKEMEAMALLDHPNIVQFCDIDEAHDTFYYAMEYVDGVDLGKYVSLAGPLPVPEACDYIRQTALGLQHAHEHNLVHRDIKPVNLYLTHVPVPHQLSGSASRPSAGKILKQPLIKILDWGLADLRQPHNQTQAEMMAKLAGGVLGTADYLSPEQARNAHAVDIRGDLYSLGCSFYYLLTGQAPFPTGSLAQKLLLHQQAEPEPVEDFRQDVPAGILTLLHRLMAKQPEDRYQTPAALALDLLPYLRGDQPIYSLSREQLAKVRGIPLPAPQDPTPLPRSLADRLPLHRPQPGRPRFTAAADVPRDPPIH